MPERRQIPVGVIGHTVHGIRKLFGLKDEQPAGDRAPSPAGTPADHPKRRVTRPETLIQHDAIGAMPGLLGGPGIDGHAVVYRKASNRAADRRQLFPRGVDQPVGMGKAGRKKHR